MLLKRFQVQGYKNFREPVVLDALSRMNVIHGPNNVGKSNLLQAISLFFYLLMPGDEQPKQIPMARGEPLSEEELTGAGFAPHRMFNLQTQQPIEMLATLATEPGELEALGIQELIDSKEVQIGIQVARILDRIELRITKFLFADGRDLTKHSANAEEHAFALRFALFLKRNFLVQTRSAGERFALIGVDRRVYPARHEAAGSEAYAGVVPEQLMLELFDARDSIEPEMYGRWELFTRVMQKFGDVLGEGTFQALFNRASGRATLAFQTPRERIPVDLLGSGIQQVVSIVARLLMTRATLLGIEEPELNLRFDTQLRLREVLVDIISGSQGPRQIFLTSHSPAFEHGEYFYGMRPTPKGPTVERSRGAEAVAFTQHHLAGEVPSGGAAVGYVSSEGLVRLPDAVRRELGLERGGGIVIWKREGAPYHELLTNEQFLENMRGAGDGDAG